MKILTEIPAEMPVQISVKENPRKRKLAAHLEFDASISQDGARWWLVLDESLRVGAFCRDQVETMLKDWFARGYVVEVR